MRTAAYAVVVIYSGLISAEDEEAIKFCCIVMLWFAAGIVIISLRLKKNCSRNLKMLVTDLMICL